MNQKEVNAEIRHLIDWAVDCEKERDRSAYESVTYWKWHDRATELHERARSLMPEPRTIGYFGEERDPLAPEPLVDLSELAEPIPEGS